MPRKLCILLYLFVLSLSAFTQESRHFTFHYAFTVKNLPAGKKVRVWIPAARTSISAGTAPQRDLIPEFREPGLHLAFFGAGHERTLVCSPTPGRVVGLVHAGE